MLPSSSPSSLSAFCPHSKNEKKKDMEIPVLTHKNPASTTELSTACRSPYLAVFLYGEFLGPGSQRIQLLVSLVKLDQLLPGHHLLVPDLLQGLLVALLHHTRSTVPLLDSGRQHLKQPTETKQVLGHMSNKYMSKWSPGAWLLLSQLFSFYVLPCFRAINQHVWSHFRKKEISNLMQPWWEILNWQAKLHTYFWATLRPCTYFCASFRPHSSEQYLEPCLAGSIHAGP